MRNKKLKAKYLSLSMSLWEDAYDLHRHIEFIGLPDRRQGLRDRQLKRMKKTLKQLTKIRRKIPKSKNY